MSNNKPHPTADELYALLKRTSLPTVLVEGKDDIIFYRKIEEDLRGLGVDMLPAGNKGAVLELHRRISENPVASPMIFVVDKDLWVHDHVGGGEKPDEVITTQGYSIENDLYMDGDLESLLSVAEQQVFREELSKFVYWYALAVSRSLRGTESAFRTHPGKILDDEEHYASEIALSEDEAYPEELLAVIRDNYAGLLRGKSLFALLVRGLSSKRREVKFSVKQLMEIGAARRGDNYQRMSRSIQEALELSNK
ncbi:DUF4435 domain-containing protein [Pseudomonas aeruginosa]|uniref:DUF4435 domain-containing protein n=1 Tax=Pseudomonas aeruginosa TaxID=287 RepID=UPI0028BB9181|nr:DUF4435 domain-containing protein [Pseudomonas aeruginosa]HBN8404120.1 DUF4435 domain-containing protein [Pseudomonas aeruginosa]HDZ3476591.1 DUF4435 domain-containing protein [Pseudomonas aeruginosa]HEH8451037.1 DUF4435 domain-containing protein [Pseudomonas aeruginosa]HEH8451420.1 DUF4435 domain-containing protein [Pseudomonas aeruginosa]